MDWGTLNDWSSSAATWLGKLTWAEVKATAELTLYFLAVFAVIGCLRKLNVIREIIKGFNESRGPIWDLRQTINDLKGLEPIIHKLGDQMALLDEKVDAARKQVAELQVESASERTEEAEELATAPASTGPRIQSPTEVANENWETLRDYWRRNTKRIEHVIDQIPDGRTRLAYDRMPRTGYRSIVNKLQGSKLITPAAANASRELIELFNRYRPKNRKVPDELIGPLQVLDKQLDQELVEYAKVVAAETSESAEPAPPPPPRARGNGARATNGSPSQPPSGAHLPEDRAT